MKTDGNLICDTISRIIKLSESHVIFKRRRILPNLKTKLPLILISLRRNLFFFSDHFQFAVPIMSVADYQRQLLNLQQPHGFHQRLKKDTLIST